MAHPMINPVEIPVADCRASPTARSVLEGHVVVLMQSIKENGLRQPINVRTIEGGYEVRGGGHRLEAFRRLGLAAIPAFIREDDDLHAELAEIDENLCRNDLSRIERDLAIARRKEIYEELHPETVHGATGRAGKKSRLSGDIKAPAPRFTKATAEATGEGERTIQKSVARVAGIDPALLRRAINTHLDAAEQVDALTKLSPEKQVELIDRAVAGDKSVNAKAEFKKEVRINRERDLGQKQGELPNAKFGVIYADPPWRFEVRSENGMDRSADNHYPTMEMPDILAMKVPEIAAEDCVLFLWATVPMLQEAMATMAAWGFSYKSHCIWAKDQQGTGYWFFNKHELLLVGTKGNIPAPTPGTQPVSVITAPVRDHSRKPIVFRAFIEKLFPTLPKVELFARTAADGWHQWGKEAPLSERALPAREEDIEGKEIVEKTTAEKRDAKLMADAIVDAAGGEEMEIPAFLRRPQLERVE